MLDLATNAHLPASPVAAEQMESLQELVATAVNEATCCYEEEEEVDGKKMLTPKKKTPLMSQRTCASIEKHRNKTNSAKKTQACTVKKRNSLSSTVHTTTTTTTTTTTRTSSFVNKQKEGKRKTQQQNKPATFSLSKVGNSLRNAQKLLKIQEIHDKHFTSQREIQQLLTCSASSAKIVDVKAKMSHQEVLIRRLKGHLRELNRQKSSFYVDCMSFEKSLRSKIAMKIGKSDVDVQKFGTKPSLQNGENTDESEKKNTKTAKDAGKEAKNWDKESKFLPPNRISRSNSFQHVRESLSERGMKYFKRKPKASACTQTTDASSEMLTNDIVTTGSVSSPSNNRPSLNGKGKDYFTDAVQKAISKVEEKWHNRSKKQIEEYESMIDDIQARCSMSATSHSNSSILLLEEKTNETKKLDSENTALKVELKQFQNKLEVALKEVEFLQHVLEERDEEKDINAKTFWMKTTDLQKKNRNLEKERSNLETENSLLLSKNKAFEGDIEKLKTNILDHEAKSNLLRDKMIQLEHEKMSIESLLKDEKLRCEKYIAELQECRTENTAIYAQLLATEIAAETEMKRVKDLNTLKEEELNKQIHSAKAEKMLFRCNSNVLEHIPDVGKKDSGIDSTSDMQKTELMDLKNLTQEVIILEEKISRKDTIILTLEKKIYEGEQMRRKLHNTIQELRGNIRVHCRVRPYLPSDNVSVSNQNPVVVADVDGLRVSLRKDSKTTYDFSYDKIHPPNTGQEDIFKDVSDFIQSAVDGYNVCIFAYGQTGSGKTHTMQGSGTGRMRGIIPRSITHIMESCLSMAEDSWEYSLEVTFLEIYNETIRDLLGDNSSDKKYVIRLNESGKMYVSGLCRVPITFENARNEIEDVMACAMKNRSVAHTAMNDLSSRSHSIFTLYLNGRNGTSVVEGSLSLVDLAGSERLSRSGAEGKRLKEAQAINKSLSSLADVFVSLAQRNPHIPYRNSKLTQVLQPALSGDGKTLMMVNLSPTEESLDESLCSLRFAQKVSQCELGMASKNVKSVNAADNPSPKKVKSKTRKSSLNQKRP